MAPAGMGSQSRPTGGPYPASRRSEAGRRRQSARSGCVGQSRGMQGLPGLPGQRRQCRPGLHGEWLRGGTPWWLRDRSAPRYSEGTRSPNSASRPPTSPVRERSPKSPRRAPDRCPHFADYLPHGLGRAPATPSIWGTDGRRRTGKEEGGDDDPGRIRSREGEAMSMHPLELTPHFSPSAIMPTTPALVNRLL